MMHALHYGGSRRILARVLPDAKYPTMFRIHWPNGEVSDMVNLTCAKDAAEVLCREHYPDLPHDGRLKWKYGQTRAGAPLVSFKGGTLPTLQADQNKRTSDRSSGVP